MKKIMLVLAIVIGFIGESVYAGKFEPYLKFGTIDSAEKDHSRANAHKLMIGLGGNFIFGGEDAFKKTLNAEFWTMAEPVDRDFEVPHDGILLSGKLSYDFKLNEDVLISPFVGLGFENWRRNSPDDFAQDEFYGDLCFFNLSVGSGLKYKNWYADAEVFLPFYTNTDSGHSPDGELGYGFNVGYAWENGVRLGWFYTQKSFGGDGSQTDFELSQYGLVVGYRF